MSERGHQEDTRKGRERECFGEASGLRKEGRKEEGPPEEILRQGEVGRRRDAGGMKSSF